MLEFVVLTITIVIGSLVAVYFLYNGASPEPVSTVPGMDPSVPKDGNLLDIINSGGLHPFLTDLHKTFGPIAGFWYGEQYMVSLASAELLKQQAKVFDRPGILFKSLEPLIGQNSIQYANGIEGRQRRKNYDRFFSHQACKNYYDIFNELGEGLSTKWSTLPVGQHIPLHQYMIALALKSILVTAFGHAIDEKRSIHFNRMYDIAWSELTARLAGPIPQKDSPREIRFQEALGEMKSVVHDLVQQKKMSKAPIDENTFLDFLMNESETEQHTLDDALTYIIGGFHTTGNLLTWAIYYLGTHQDVQEKLYRELVDNLQSQPVSPENINDLKYLRMVINETLRVSVLAPFAARYQEIDIEIGGHIIPKNTPVIHALGVLAQDPKHWSMPHEFDPEKFAEETLRSHPSHSFIPFGFAGGRVCPGQQFAYIEVSIFLAILCRKFHVELVEGQVVTPSYSLVTRPEDEIWITITSRKQR